MKKVFSLPLFLLLVLTCCDALTEKPKANVVLDSAVEKITVQYGWPGFAGYVKNIEAGVAYQCSVDIKFYSDANKSTLIGWYGTRPKFTLAAGERRRFEITCSECKSHKNIKSYRGEINWVNEDNSDGIATF